MSNDNYILFLESLNEIDRSLRRTNDLNQTLENVLDTMLSIFKSDRAWLLYPCNPDASSWGVPMERTRKGYPGALSGGKNIPMLPEAVSIFKAALESEKPVTYDENSNQALTPEASKQFQIRSLINTAIYPKIGDPWLLGMHQCSYPRVWSEEDQSLFHEIGRRIADALSTLLVLNNLEESERKYRALVESSNDLHWEVNRDGVYTYVSPKIKEILGYDPEEIIGKTPFDLMDKGEVKRIETQFNKAVQNRTATVTIEHPNCHKDGHTVILETKGVPIIHTDGTFIGFRGVDRDITERKETQIRLKRSEERYRKVYSTAPMAFIVWDKDCRVLEWNDQAEKLFGYKMAEVKGKNFFDLIIPEIEKEAVKLAVENLLKGEIDKNGIYQNITKDGDLIWCEWYRSILRDENNEITGAISLGLDITERIKTENQLKASERTYREIFDGSNDVLFIHDIETGKIIDVSSKVTELYGYKPSELIGNTVDFLSKGEPPYTAVEALEWIKKTIKEGPQIYEWMASNKESDSFWVEVSLKKVSINEKDRLMAVVRDIRQRKASEKELTKYREHLEDLVDQRAAEIKAKNKELETFTYSVSHDLKAPLRGIDGYSRLLVEEYSDKLDEEGVFFLKNVRQGTTQMNRLIEDLLAYSRTERKALHYSPIDLKSFIENLVGQRTHDIKEHRIDLKIEVPYETIESDTETLRQVLTNYLDNAIKYSKKNTSGTVTIGGSHDDEYWTLWVKDDGIGFDPKYLDRIFDIFQRLHRVEEYPGTGVGLAIVRKAVERIGGKVRANSSPGKGSTFYLDIPKNKPVTL